MVDEIGFELPLPELFDVDLFNVDSLVDGTLADTGILFDDSVFRDVQEQKTVEKSPFHESDSGVSDLSGKSPSRDMDIPVLEEVLDDFTGMPPFLLSSFESDRLASQDEALSKYLQEGDSSNAETDDISILEAENATHSISRYLQEGDSSNDQIDSVSVSIPQAENASVSHILRPKTRSQSAAVGKEQVAQSSVTHGFQTTEGTGFVDALSRTHTAKKVDSGSESNSSINIVDGDGSTRRPKGSVRVKQIGAKLPSATTSDKCNVTSVKVLRIVKSGSDSNTEDDVAKALEERNRKNAEMARQNRLKKKEYVGNLENEVEDGRKRIGELESALSSAEEERDSYKKEVEYLKSVLANQSALAGLLKNIPHVSGVTLSSSVSRKRVAELDHSYTPMKKTRHAGPSQSSRSGVCLHVDSNNVSLEFCHHCANMAKGGQGSSS